MELIKIFETNGKHAVSAKELYLFLSIDNGSNFSKWAKVNIQDMFIENIDYQNLRINYDNGGRPLNDYALHIDCAKEVAMMSRCDNGKQARLYFIECEKKLKDLTPKFELPQTFAQALMLAAKQAELIEKQQTELNITQPKALVYDIISDCTNLKTIGEISKIIGTGRNRFFEYLRNKKILMTNNLPYQNYIEQGYFIVKTNPIKTIHKNISTTFVTSKGELYLTKLFNNL